MGRHDRVFRSLMAEPGVAEALLRERLPRSLVASFSGPPEALPEHFIDESLKASIADQVLRVPRRGGRDGYVYCLLEHKRTPDVFVLVQVLRYVSALYTRLAKQRGGRRSLPPVVAMIVYNGEPRWRGPRRFSELIGASRALRRFCVDFEVVLVDVGAEPASRIARHQTLKGGLLALKAAATGERRQPAIIRSVISALKNDRSTLTTFLGYLGDVAGKQGLPLIQRALEEKDEEDAMQTINQYLEMLGRRKGMRAGLKKGLEQGIEKGLEKGLEKGQELALRRSLTRVLEKRFKKIPASLDTKLAEADAATLETWLDAAIDARSLRAVFAPPH